MIPKPEPKNTDEKPKKSGRGGWRPGSGRPRKPENILKAQEKELSAQAKKDFAALARAMAPDLLPIMKQIAENKKAPPSARVSAITAIWDRGLGKPPQHLEHTGKDGAPLFSFFAQLEAEDEAEAKGETLQ